MRKKLSPDVRCPCRPLTSIDQKHTQQGSSYNSTVEDSLASMMSMSSDNQERPLVAAASDAEGMGAMQSVPQAVLDQEQNLGTSVASARTSTISDVREGSTSTPLSAEM